jgi:hypothetical protein
MPLQRDTPQEMVENVTKSAVRPVHSAPQHARAVKGVGDVPAYLVPYRESGRPLDLLS